MVKFSGLWIFIVTLSLVSLALSPPLVGAQSMFWVYDASIILRFIPIFYLSFPLCHEQDNLPPVDTPHHFSAHIDLVSPDQSRAKTGPAEYSRNQPRTD